MGYVWMDLRDLDKCDFELKKIWIQKKKRIRSSKVEENKVGLS